MTNSTEMTEAELLAIYEGDYERCLHHLNVPESHREPPYSACRGF